MRTHGQVVAPPPFAERSALVFCAANISEGRDREIYDRAAARVTTVPGVVLLGVDPGFSTNRTVISFAGEASAMREAAFRLAEVALASIDMRRHEGVHPRLGALDVVPFVPLGDTTMELCVKVARDLGARLGEELSVPVFLYDRAARRAGRDRLPSIRAGQYEGLAQKLASPDWLPDFGPARFVPRSGAVVVGARKPLLAFNVNLSTCEVSTAARIAARVRERGGRLLGVRAIGWVIPELGAAQVSMNLIDLAATPLHVAFEVCCEEARAAGARVLGSELIGMIGREVLVAAGAHLGRAAAGEEACVAAAIAWLGLDAKSVRGRILEERIGVGFSMHG